LNLGSTLGIIISRWRFMSVPVTTPRDKDDHILSYHIIMLSALNI